MLYSPATPFDHIEGTHEYLTLLGETIEESTREVEEELARSAGRRREGFQLALYTLARLEAHVRTSRRLVKNLGVLRRLLVSQAAEESRALEV
jgi:hypothetical protein